MHVVDEPLRRVTGVHAYGEESEDWQRLSVGSSIDTSRVVGQLPYNTRSHEAEIVGFAAPYLLGDANLDGTVSAAA